MPYLFFSQKPIAPITPWDGEIAEIRYAPLTWEADDPFVGITTDARYVPIPNPYRNVDFFTSPPFLVGPIELDIRCASIPDRIHREFAILEGPRDFARFATAYGWLGRGRCFIRAKDGRMMQAESVEFWRESVESLRLSWERYDRLIQAKRKGNIARFLRNEGVDPPLDLDKRGGDWMLSPLDPRYSDAVLRAAYDSVESEINEALALSTWPAISAEEGSSIYINPRDLLGAIWASFALEVIGRLPTSVKCGGCGAHFEPSRSDQKYHNDACRMRAKRREKREAKNARKPNNGGEPQ